MPSRVPQLDMGSRAALTAFDVIAALSPSDARSIARQLPHKRVVHVPHAIEPPRIPVGQATLRCGRYMMDM